jgi:hypothetical protein
VKTFKITRRFFISFAAALALVALAHAFLPPAVRALYPGRESSAASPFRQFDRYQKAQAVSRREVEIMKGGKHYKRLQMVADYAVIDEPWLVDVKESKLADSTAVIGVVVEGQSFAFVKDALYWPSQHIVNMVVEETPISVTYCSLADCVRVLTRDDAQPIDLQVGGLDVDNRLVVTLDGERYSQLSNALPLEDHEFEVTTLGDWKQRHPNSKIYEQPTWLWRDS